MKEKHLLNEYYKRKLYGGRTRLARGVDFIVFRALLLIVLYLWFSTKLQSPALQAFLSLIALSLFCVAAALYKSIRLDRFKLRENESLRREYTRRQMLLMSGERFISMVRDYASAHPEAYGADCLVVPLQRSEALGCDCILAIYRRAQRCGCEIVALFSPAPLSKEAQALLDRSALPIILQSDAVFSAMAQRAGITLSDEGIEEFLLEKLRAEKAQRKKSAGPFVISRVKRYLAVALALFAASFFVRYTLYYRLMAAVCVSLASLAWWLEKSVPPQKQ